MAQVFKLDPASVRGFARDLYGVSDGLHRLQIDAALAGGTGACPGTDLVAGLGSHADEQHREVQNLSRELDGLGDEVMHAIDAFVRLDDALALALIHR